jgi:signal transduction histidine kinase/CheY-like chemotaxis protein
VKFLQSLNGLFQDSIGGLAPPAEQDATGSELEGGSRRMFFTLMTGFSLVTTIGFSVGHYLDGAENEALLNAVVACVVLAALALSTKASSLRWPMMVVTLAIVALLATQTLRQGQGLHGAGWWLSVIPFVLAAGGFHRLALTVLAVFFGVVSVLYLAPELNPFHASPKLVSPGRQLFAILGSECLAVALIVASMKRRTNIARALDRSRGAALDAAALKARFLANMSHEIRTPLLGLIGAIELMRSNNTSQSQRQQLVSLAESSARTLHSLINDVLDYSKLDSGELRLEHSVFNLRQVCYQVNELFAVKAFDRGLELTSTCDLDVPSRFVGDSVRIKQLVSNLVSNAVKFTKTGGVHIHLSIGQRAGAGPGAFQANGPVWVRIDVSDTGMGISPEQRAALFKPFAQADSSITRRFGGTGLGLSISAELAKVMGGTLTVDSQEGIGSTFTFRVPLQPHVATDAKTTPTAKGTGGKVVMVSRSAGLQRHISGLLTELGRPSRCFSACPSASQLKDIKTLVLDASSFASGPELQKQVGQLTHAGMHVVLLQPLGSDSLVGLFGASSNISIVHKPVRLSTLRKALEPLSRLSRAVSDAAEKLGESAPTTPARPSRFAETRILVAEDNPVNQVIISAMLAELGAGCDMVSNGAEAVEAFKAKDYDIVLMDLQMPEMGGLEATQHIRVLESSSWRRIESHVPVIAMTANTERDELAERQAAGMSGYLGKPFRLSELQACLLTWCLKDAVDSERQPL